MKVKTSYEGAENITAGKAYELTDHDGLNVNETIINDAGCEMLIVGPSWTGIKCSYLNNEGYWEPADDTN